MSSDNDFTRADDATAPERITALELELEQTQQSFRAMLERSPDGMLVRSDGHVVYANPAALTALGFEAGHDLTDVDVTQLVDLDDSRSTRERGIARRDGTAIVAQVGSLPIVFDGKHALLLVVRDVTERRRIEAQLLVAARMASMGTVAAGVAHEVNNPLGYMIANVNFALEELNELQNGLVAGDDEEASDLAARLARARAGVRAIVEALREARQGGDRVRHIVRDLKTFSRVDDERRGPLEIRRVLESAINVAYSEIRHRARLVKDYGPTPLVEANEARLGQVFLNLLVNAVQAIGEGDVERHSIRVVTRTDDDGRCVVEVSDTGQGIAPENLRRIFDPFFTTKQGSGTGLGLSICQNIVTAMGGDIAVESTVGRGSTFRISLPSSSEEVQATDASSRASAGMARRGRVLVIDDEPMMARALQRLLEGEHDVVVTSDPVGAVEQVRAGARFDAVLCDLMMPTMSGMDVYDAIAAIAPDQARRIVFITGGVFTPRASEFLESVDNPRLEKPLEQAALRTVLRTYMN